MCYFGTCLTILMWNILFINYILNSPQRLLFIILIRWHIRVLPPLLWKCIGFFIHIPLIWSWSGAIIPMTRSLWLQFLGLDTFYMVALDFVLEIRVKGILVAFNYINVFLVGVINTLEEILGFLFSCDRIITEMLIFLIHS